MAEPNGVSHRRRVMSGFRGRQCCVFVHEGDTFDELSINTLCVLIAQNQSPSFICCRHVQEGAHAEWARFCTDAYQEEHVGINDTIVYMN